MKIVYRVSNISDHTVVLYSLQYPSGLKIDPGDSLVVEDINTLPTLLNIADPSLGVLKLRKEVLVDGE